MNKLNVLALMVCGALLAGCASVPMASAHLDLEAKKFIPDPGKASVYVSRGVGTAWGYPVQIVLDGRIVGSLAQSTYQMLRVPPGDHIISTGGQFENVDQVKFTAEAGKDYFFDVGFGMGWAQPRVHLEQLGEEEGRKAVTGSKRAESANY